jgi:hypothetical protein
VFVHAGRQTDIINWEINLTRKLFENSAEMNKTKARGMQMNGGQEGVRGV